MEKIRLNRAVVVEGRHDKHTLSNYLDALIIETDGFRIFKDKAKLNLLRRLAQSRGLIVLTDGDGAGRLIRNHLKSTVDKDRVIHAYIPDILGKEKRKAAPSAEGKLGVEGMSFEIIKKALMSAGALEETPASPESQITAADFYALGLTGNKMSSIRRKALAKALDFPEQISAKAMLDAVNVFLTLEELKALIADMAGDIGDDIAY